MAQHNFEELKVWKRSARLAVSILELADSMKLYALRDQMVRSSLSIPSNIAEGAERDSDREFRRFLSFAKASAGELRTQLYVSQRAGVIASEVTAPLIAEAKEISSMLQGLMKKVSKSWIPSVFGWLF